MQMVLDLGGQIGAGMEVDGLVLEPLSAGAASSSTNGGDSRRVAKGVRLTDGTILEADLIICATGAWSVLPSPSCSLLPPSPPSRLCLSSLMF